MSNICQYLYIWCRGLIFKEVGGFGGRLAVKNLWGLLTGYVGVDVSHLWEHIGINAPNYFLY